MSPPRGAGLGVAVGVGETPGALGGRLWATWCPRLALSVDLPFLDTSYRRNHPSFMPASFTHSCLGTHSRGSVY